MNAPDPMLRALAAAHDSLLAPFGLDEAALARALKLITAHRVDDADLYFQTTRAEGWSLEEGIVKSGSFSIDQGVGVRAVAGEKTAFAYSDAISEAALADCATTVRSIAAAGHSRRVKVQPRHAQGLQLYGADDPIASLDSASKVALLERVERMARAKDPAVVQVMAGLAAEHEIVLIARADLQKDYVGVREIDHETVNLRGLGEIAVVALTAERSMGGAFDTGELWTRVPYV